MIAEMKNIVLFSLVVFNSYLPAQVQTNLTEWNQAQQQLFLLRNDRQIIPIQQLDRTRVTLTTFGFDTVNALTEYASAYTTVKYLNTQTFYPPVKNPVWATHPKAVHLVAVNLQVYFIPSQLTDLLMAYRPEEMTILILFGHSSFMQGLKVPDHVDAVLYASGTNELYQSLTAQALFGGVGINNRLVNNLNAQYSAGEGLDNGGKIRLGYAPPEIAGMDRKLLQDSISFIVQEGITAQAFPGAQVMVIKDGWVVYHQAFGKHTYTGTQPVKKTDLYDFASVTKISTSTLAMMDLVSQNKVNLDEPLGTYVSEMGHSDKSKIPVRQYLAHNARLKASIVFWAQTKKTNGAFKPRTFKPDSSASYPIQVTNQLWLHKNYPPKMYKGIKKSALNPEPGYVYSDLSFILYPLIAQRMTGVPFEDYLKSKFYYPLGAYSLTFNPLRFYDNGQILPTEQDTFFRKQLVHGTVHDESAAMLRGISGHAGLFGSANDLAKLATMYKNYGSYGGAQYLKPEVVLEFTRCQYCAEGNRRGLGFERPLITYDAARSHVAKEVSEVSFGHSGFTGTFVWIDPRNDLVYIFFSNRVYPSRSHVGISTLSIRPRIQQAIYDSF